MKPIPWWALAAAIAAPVLLIGGFLVATAVQPASYNPVRDTISELAGRGATHSWLMTSALAGLGLCYLLCALGLHPAGSAGRVLLAGGGIATLSIAAFRQPRHGYSLAHELAVIAAALTCCTWPVFASHRRHPAVLLTRVPSCTAAGVSVGARCVVCARKPWRHPRSRGAVRGCHPSAVVVRCRCHHSVGTDTTLEPGRG